MSSEPGDIVGGGDGESGTDVDDPDSDISFSSGLVAEDGTLNLFGLAERGVGTIFYGAILAVITLVESIRDLVVGILSAAGGYVVDVISTISSSTASSIESIPDAFNSTLSSFGLAAFPISVVVAIVVGYGVIVILQTALEVG
jgi:hypothetical protein